MLIQIGGLKEYQYLLLMSSIQAIKMDMQNKKRAGTSQITPEIFSYRTQTLTQNDR